MENTRLNSNYKPSINELAITIEGLLLKQNKRVIVRQFGKER